MRVRKGWQSVDPEAAIHVSYAAGVALQCDAEGARTTVDLECRVGAGAARRSGIDRQRRAQGRRRQPRGRAAQLFCRLRRKLVDQRQHAVERARIEVERHGAARRVPPGIDTAFDRERGTAEIGDRDLLDVDSAGVDAHADIGLLRLDAADHGARELERERALAWPIEGTVAKHGLGERVSAVDVDVGGIECRVEPRRPVAMREGIGETAGDGHAVELELEPVDCHGITAELYVAADAERPHGRGLDVGAFGQPGGEPARIVRLDPGRAIELDARCGRREPATETHLGDPGRAEFQRLDLEPARIRHQIGADALKHGASERHRLDADAQARRDRKLQGRCEGRGQHLHGGERPPAGRLGQRQHAVEVDLRRRQHSGNPRLRAEGQVGIAAQLDRPVVGPVLKFDLFQHRGRTRPLDAAGRAPRLDDDGLRTGRRPPDGARYLQASVEARSAVVDGDRHVGIHVHRPIDRLDREAHLGGAVASDPAHAQAVGIVLASEGECALALDRARERAQLAFERDLVNDEAAAACGIGESRTAIRDGQVVDRDPVEIETGPRRWPNQTAVAVEPERQFGAFDLGIADAPLAARQGAECELDPQGSGAALPRLGWAAECHVVQHQGRRRQEPRVNSAGDMKIEAGQTAGVGFEFAAVAVPVDKKRSDQRRD